jgi:hypothetical protein
VRFGRDGRPGMRGSVGRVEEESEEGVETAVVPVEEGRDGTFNKGIVGAVGRRETGRARERATP